MSFFVKYLQEMSDCILKADEKLLLKASDGIKQASGQNGKVIIVGNGGSAAIASHVSVDLTKAAGIRSVNFNEADLITCLANDFGYEHWVAKALEYYADSKDLIILISSSGRSANMINGADQANKMGLNLITFSGFERDNALRSRGKINFWVDSRDYNMVEMTHHVWLLAIADKIISKT